ncbi:MAG: hypothetical protein K9H25_13525 [Rhodospirillum sp.]|nr:hypothetical protein [Rhodospirillum sp.]MCF8487781.1 hypothetical protein [Rhodospirillum sp.]
MSALLSSHLLTGTLVAVTLTLAPLSRTGVARAQSPEDLLATYQARCTSEAHRDAARKGPREALDHGALCDDLAKRIQKGLETQGTGAKASPLARPDPTVWPDSGSASPVPPPAHMPSE